MQDTANLAGLIHQIFNNQVTLYYTPPSDELFDEVKETAIEVWEQYDNEYET